LENQKVSTSPSQPSSTFSGIWPALLTPLDESLDIDTALFAAHARDLLEAGCTGVTPFGTTGEGPSFSATERMAAIDALIAGGVPAQRILVSSSCAALPDAVALTRHAVQSGCFGSLLLPPFFLKGVPDQGVIDAYRWVIDQVADPRLRVVLYHIPQVSGVGLSLEVIRTLKSLYPETIVGIKDSSCQIATSLQLAGAFMPPLQVWVGNEPDLPELGRRGSRGAVSGLANFVPRLVRRLVNEPDAPRTAADLERVKRLLSWLGGYALTPAFKGIMAARTGRKSWLRVRPPLVALRDDAFARLQQEVRAFALDPAAD
jgi:4-hydroxy-tetrahydrodipicolinate synthase